MMCVCLSGLLCVVCPDSDIQIHPAIGAAMSALEFHIEVSASQCHEYLSLSDRIEEGLRKPGSLP